MLKIIGKNIQITRGDDGFIDLKIRSKIPPYTIYKLEEGDSCVLTIRKNIKVDEENPILIQIPLEDNKFYIKASDTQDFEFGKYIYDVQLTFENGMVNTIIEPSLFEVTPEVTY